MKTKQLILLSALALAPLSLHAERGEGEGRSERGPRGEKGHRPPSAEVIAEFDTDGDGKLTGEERKAAKAARKAKRAEEKAAMLAEFDTDEDGKLSKEERKAMMLSKFDTDKDGELSKEERQAAREEMGPRHGKKGKRGKGRGKGNRPRGARKNAE